MRRLGLLVLGCLLGSSLEAAPLHYQIELKAGPPDQPIASPIAGATLRLNLTWDAISLIPLQSDATKTVWPSSNTVGTLTFIGSAASDGVYNATFATSPSLTWVNSDNDPSVGDRIRFPAMRFEIDGHSIATDLLQATFADTHFLAPHPFLPKAFGSADATWSTLRFFKLGFPQIGTTATVLSGFAESVPEPAAATMGGFALLALAALRRRK